jgi:hypothetical protein
MHDDWRQWARQRGWKIEGDILIVEVGKRQQRIHITESSEGSRLTSVVAKRSVVQEIGGLDLQAWKRNRTSDLVGFKINKKGYLVGETQLPKDASKDEWSYLVFNLARAADRFEYVLTGRDVE